MYLDFADVLSSKAEDGKVFCTIGDVRNAFGMAGDCPMTSSDGFISRPNDPDDRGCAQALYWHDSGNEKYLIGVVDHRFADKVGTLGPGDRAIITDGEARVFVHKATDSVEIVTADKKTGNTMLVSVDGSTGNISIVGPQTSIDMGVDDTGGGYIALRVAGGAALTLDKNGIKIVGKHLHAACPGGILGGDPMVPVTAPPQAILRGVAGITGMPSVGWFVTV
jgi:hypothetical protein